MSGSAKILAHLGYAALATTSSGFANSLGRHDGGVTREEAIAHGADARRGDAAAGERRPRERLRHQPRRGRRHGGVAPPRPGSPGARSRIGTPDERAIYDRRPGRRPRRCCRRRRPRRTGPPGAHGARREPHPRASTTSTTRSPAAGVRRRRCRRRVRPGHLDRPSRSARVVDAVDVPVNVLVRPGVPPICRAGRARRRPRLRRRRVRPRRPRCPRRRRP